MHIHRRVPLALAVAALALPALTACGDDNDAPGVVTLEVSGDQLRIPDTFTTRVRFTVRNNSTAAISVFRCNGQTMHTLERRVREPDEWMLESSNICQTVPAETIVLEPGAARRAPRLHLPAAGAEDPGRQQRRPERHVGQLRGSAVSGMAPAPC